MNYLELAKQAGFVEYELDDGTTEAFDKRYAKLVALAAAQEREECIKLVHKGTGEPVQIRTLVILQKERKRIADEIKARGTT
jgi:hypothetical protein